MQVFSRYWSNAFRITPLAFMSADLTPNGKHVNIHNSDREAVNRYRTQTVLQVIRDGCRPAIPLSNYGVSIWSLKILNFSETHLLIETIGLSSLLAQTVWANLTISLTDWLSIFFFNHNSSNRRNLGFETAVKIQLTRYFIKKKTRFKKNNKKQTILVLLFTGCQTYFIMLDVSFQQV